MRNGNEFDGGCDRLVKMTDLRMLSSSKGNFPVVMAYKITPQDQISLRKEKNKDQKRKEKNK